MRLPRRATPTVGVSLQRQANRLEYALLCIFSSIITIEITTIKSVMGQAAGYSLMDKPSASECGDRANSDDQAKVRQLDGRVGWPRLGAKPLIAA